MWEMIFLGVAVVGVVAIVAVGALGIDAHDISQWWRDR
jgi:hypothetical protein